MSLTYFCHSPRSSFFLFPFPSSATASFKLKMTLFCCPLQIILVKYRGMGAKVLGGVVYPAHWTAVFPLQSLYHTGHFFRGPTAGIFCESPVSLKKKKEWELTFQGLHTAHHTTQINFLVILTEFFLQISGTWSYLLSLSRSLSFLRFEASSLLCNISYPMGLKKKSHEFKS